MENKDLRAEFRMADVRQWEVAEALGIAEMTFVKWLRRELPEDKKKRVRKAILEAKDSKRQ